MEVKNFTASGKEITIYLAEEKDCPLIVLNNYSGDGSPVVNEIRKRHTKEFNLLCVSGLNWNHDMTPWYCPPVSPEDTPCTGGADEYLKLLLEEILPEGLEAVKGVPEKTGIAGYSLGGLFALYACYHCDTFDRVAGMSGSLWFPNFKEYIFSHSMKKKPEKIYLSLGDKEARARNQMLRTVRDRTEEIIQFYRKNGLTVEWELNPGNHFKDETLRSAKGITAILSE